MAILSKGTDFTTGDQVTAANLDALVDSATFASGAVDNTSTALDDSSPKKIIVKDGGISTSKLADSSSTTTGVTFAKMQHVAANTVMVRDANSEGDISAKAVTDTQILIGNGTGFTATALSGDATMTNAGVVDISNDVALGGNPTTTTQSSSDNSTKIATTAYVTTAVSGLSNFAKFTDTAVQSGTDNNFTNRSFDSVTTASSSYFSLSSGKAKILIAGMYALVFRATFNVLSSSFPGEARIINESDSDEVVIQSQSKDADGTYTFRTDIHYFDANDELRLQSKGGSFTLTNLDLIITHINSATF